MRSGERRLGDAASNGDVAAVEALVRGGADVNAKDAAGSSALAKAAASGLLDVARYLVEHGADTEAASKNGYTALALAAWRGRLDVVGFLVELGADKEAKSKGGYSALILAACNGHLGVTRCLVEQGADTNARTDDGYTALAKAAENGLLDIGRYLVERGADVHAKSNGGNTVLMKAAQFGRLDMARYLVEQGADIHARNNNGDTALLLAAENGRVEVVRFLLEQGADVHATNKRGVSAMMWAAQLGRLDMTRLLSERGADMHAKDDNGDTALTKAACNGRLNVVRHLVEQGADTNAQSNNGDSALIQAASNGHLDVVRFLIEQGVDIQAENSDGYTSLMLATSHGHLDLMRLLVDQGADIDTTNGDGDSALMKAASNCHLEKVVCLVELGADLHGANNYDNTALMWAAYYDRLDVVRYLVEQGVDIHAEDQEGYTALTKAASDGHLNVVRYLVDQGADTNANRGYGETALMKGTSNGHLDVVRYLVEHGADKEAQNYAGYTALIMAVSNGRHDIVQYFVEQGADIDARNGDEDTALTKAAYKSHLDMVRFLVEQGADINAKNISGESALIMGAENGAVDIVRCLVEHGAYIDARNNDDYTALIMAAEYGRVDVVRYLAEQGADIHATGQNGNSALMKAATQGHLDVARYLVEHGADANLKDADGETAIHKATMRGHISMRSLLMQQMKYVASISGTRGGLANADQSVASLKSYLTSRSWAISPFDIEVVEYGGTKTIGGEYRAKWLDADVVIKLFVPSASVTSFAEEVTAWHQLRHPNVLKLYGACDVGHSFFMLEYASNGSLVEYLAECERKNERRTPWKYLYEASLGLAYLHGRGIVHGNLRSSNILIGSDGVAKLADFGLAKSSQEVGDATAPSGASFWSLRWQPPEQLKDGTTTSFAADMYSFGLCVVEAVSGRELWAGESDYWVLRYKRDWDPFSSSSSWGDPGQVNEDTRLVTSRLCALDPNQRSTAAAAVRLLEELAAKEANQFQAPQSEPDNTKMNAEEYKAGALPQLLAKLRDLVSSQYAEDPLCQLVLQETEAIHEQLVQASRPVKLFEAYHLLLMDLVGVLQSGSLLNRVAALSSTRTTGNNLTALQRRMDDLWMVLDNSRVGDQERERRWNAQRKRQLGLFVSDVSETMTVLSKLDSHAEQTLFIALLKMEIERHASDYTASQLTVMNRAYDDICQGEWGKSVATIPVWFLPWYELEINRMKKLGEGGFGDVYLAKWLDSQVVVKEVKALGSGSNGSFASIWSQSAPQSATSVRVGATTSDIESRKALRAMFEHEVKVWFDLSHPHVVRLFGACHIGTPFFACEYAGRGSLEGYLQQHPDELWTKLFEAALGVHYLQSRDIIHGDLKCNNIMVGNDGHAKVTDFGLSSFEDSSEAKVSGAWQWVAPECIEHGASERSFASDVYSFGMCIVEALRVVELVKLDKLDDDGPPPLPWGDLGNEMVKYRVRRKELPLRPQQCTDAEWRLVQRMCAHDPRDRIKISTVVDELAALARGDATREEDATEPERESLETELSLPEVIAEMKDTCRQFRDKASSRDLKLLCQIYELQWSRLAHLASATVSDDAAFDVECLRPHVERARTSMLGLEKQTDTLFAFTETALRGYALHRELSKTVDANMWRVGEDVQAWKAQCWELLAGAQQ